jgi:hypothetical protein
MKSGTIFPRWAISPERNEEEILKGLGSSRIVLLLETGPLQSMSIRLMLDNR